MTRTRLSALTVMAIVSFAGNSLLCRVALNGAAIDAASFTSVRIVAGAFALWLIVRIRGGVAEGSANLPSAFALFAYAAAFSFAYVSLPAGTGAILLFGAVQASMIGYGLWTGERFRARQTAGFACAIAGLVGLVLPGISAPPLAGSALMIVAGAAWGVYSLRGRRGGDPIRTTAGNFWLAIPFAGVLSIAGLPWMSLDRAGIAYAIVSGAATSGVGYAIWYTALKGLHATHAATVQLAVPVVAAIGGIVLLGEVLQPRLLIASTAILGGIALVILGRQPAES